MTEALWANMYLDTPKKNTRSTAAGVFVFISIVF
jgi:hypothetical protein